MERATFIEAGGAKQGELEFSAPSAQPEVARAPSRFPYFAVATLSLIMALNSYTLANLFPYVGVMVQGMLQHESTNEVGERTSTKSSFYFFLMNQMEPRRCTRNGRDKEASTIDIVLNRVRPFYKLFMSKSTWFRDHSLCGCIPGSLNDFGEEETINYTAMYALNTKLSLYVSRPKPSDRSFLFACRGWAILTLVSSLQLTYTPHLVARNPFATKNIYK